MATKVKGLFKGLRHMSQHIFEDGKEGEIQIGYPTDVKHVAHIGFDGQGPSAESPSWMKEFGSTRYQSAPLGVIDPKDNPEIKWVSEDSKSCRPPSYRHQSSPDNSESPKKESSRRRHSRRSKDSNSGGSTRSNRDTTAGSESPSQSPSSLPDIPKKSRRRKSKENVSGGSDGSSRKSQPSLQQDQGEIMKTGANSPTTP